MNLIYIPVILMVIFFSGFAAMGIFKENKKNFFITTSYGLVTIVLMVLCVLLVTLKFDMSFESMCRVSGVFFGLTTAIGIARMIFLMLKSKGVKRVEGVSKRDLWYLIPALLLCIYSFFLLAPSYVNDDTWEIVSTTLATDTIYEYSAMTGEKMINGLPIFNKICVMPMLYSIVCRLTGLSIWTVCGFVFPIIVFSSCIGIVSKISDEINVNNKEAFMLTYMLCLIGGTYLPNNGIPVTTGYALLREGYSGYAIAYAVSIPLFTLCFLKKKYVTSLFAMSSLIGLVRIDRIYFALKSPISWFRNINGSGKLAGIFVLALLSSALIGTVKYKKRNIVLVVAPIVFISYVQDELRSLLNEKKQLVVYSVGVSIMILSCTGFDSFSDAFGMKETKQFEKMVMKEISASRYSEECIFAPADFMAVARRLDGNVKVLYGRDDISSYMAGLDFEDSSEFINDYYLYSLNALYGYEAYKTEHSKEEIEAAFSNRGVNEFLLPDDYVALKRAE